MPGSTKPEHYALTFGEMTRRAAAERRRPSVPEAAVGFTAPDEAEEIDDEWWRQYASKHSPLEQPPL